MKRTYFFFGVLIVLTASTIMASSGMTSSNDGLSSFVRHEANISFYGLSTIAYSDLVFLEEGNCFMHLPHGILNFHDALKHCSMH